VVSIPKKCENHKVANCPLFRWWCMLICSVTGGRLCSPWCRLAERFGLWTLWITLPLAALVLYLFIRLLVTGLT